MGIFFIILAILVLLICSALFSGLTIGILSLNHYELKHKAQLGDKAAKIVYPIRALGHQLLVTLLIGNVLVNAGIVALLNTQINGILAVVGTTIFVVLFGEILPMAYLQRFALQLTARIAPVLKYIIIILAPVAKPLGKLLDSRLGEDGPNIFSKEELHNILEELAVSKHSDIDEDEIRIVRHALNFGDKQVREVMTPRRVVTTVSAEEVVGPVLLNELHASGHSRFPVYNDAQTQVFIGTLYLYDLVGVTDGGKVKDLMRKRVYYVHEEQPLTHALNAFLKTNHHLLVVVNTFEEFVGVITIEDVIEEIIGREIVDEFDNYADLRAVAQSLAVKEARQRSNKEKEKSTKEVKK
jgi:metal transporter CNNM